MKKLQMEKEMRAHDDIPMSQDITPPIPPLAFSLHDSFLNSHCSSCFHPLQSKLSSCQNCSGSVNYCSPVCHAFDSVRHSSSGECQLFNYTKSSPLINNDSTDIRVALRLLHHFETTGHLHSTNRIGGLLVSDLEKVLEEGGELADKINHDAMLMSSVSKDKQGAKLEMLVLWCVMRNSVEIQLNEFGSIGVGIYGPDFSWFNHSCVPNASYRFEIEFDNLNEKEPNFLGPRVIVRSIKPIKKGEEICITYTDLLQPKAKRQLELWSKYRFNCLCSRCSESPLNHIDYILTCDSEGRTSASSASEHEKWYDEIHEAIEEYTSFNNPKICCDKIESILLQNFLSLHPLHYLSLTAYITLSSAYRFRFFKSPQNCESNLGKILSAYSILLSFSTYNLFLFEPSLMATTSTFLINTGETILSICENQELEASSSFQLQLNMIEDFELSTRKFVECSSKLLSKCWAFLVRNNPYLEKIKSPIDFNWVSLQMRRINNFEACKIECFACKFESNMVCEEEMKYLYKLAIHCLVHGMYLGTICYGPHHYSIDKVKSLLNS